MTKNNLFAFLSDAFSIRMFVTMDKANKEHFIFIKYTLIRSVSE
jgi:hypothetical protein